MANLLTVGTDRLGARAFAFSRTGQPRIGPPPQSSSGCRSTQVSSGGHSSSGPRASAMEGRSRTGV